MSNKGKDTDILNHIVRYCEEIELAIGRFGRDYLTFSTDPVYKNAVSMCILQIGELVGLLSDEFKAENSVIPWRQIKAMRNIAAHNIRLF